MQNVIPIVKKYFYPLDRPQIGALALYQITRLTAIPCKEGYYYQRGDLVHAGIYKGDGRIESLWGSFGMGNRAIDTHTFYAPENMGDLVTYWQIRDTLNISESTNELKQEPSDIIG